MNALLERPSTTFPAATFAPQPAESRGLARDHVRLLVARPGAVEHTRFDAIADHLAPGDVLVVNTSATVAAEVDADWRDRAVVLHVAAADHGDRVVELRTAPHAAHPILDAASGDAVTVDNARLTLLEPWPDGQDSSPSGTGNRLWRARVTGDLDGVLHRDGRPIAYGYLDRRYPLADYQTVFGVHPGSAEMPSAGRPFTAGLVADLAARGVLFAPITLHTGFSSQEAGEAPGPEWFDVPATSARLINLARARGGRIVAVGTTATRGVESAIEVGAEGAAVVARTGWTSRVVTPADPPRIIDGLITGWHDPQASHLLLLEAVAGRALTQEAYDAAVPAGYLWHEFGDAALLLPVRVSRRRGRARPRRRPRPARSR